MFDQIFFPVLKLTWNIEKVIKAMEKHHGNYFYLGQEMNLNHTKKTTRNNFREFPIRIRYPMIKSRVFLHFCPIPHSPIPHKSPIPTPYPYSLNKSSLSFSSTLYLHCFFFHVDYPPGNQERREKWLWIRNKLMKSTSYSG